MFIKSITIKNFRGLDIDINSVNTLSTIIGKNDSGKTNICYALLKTLDYRCRRIPFSISDSTNSNKEEIFIKVILDVNALNEEQLGTIGQFISLNENKKELIVQLVSKFNQDTEEYEDTLTYGNPEGDCVEQKNNAQTGLDKILSIVYIGPLYDIKDSMSNYFSYKEKLNKENDSKFGKNISISINNLNEAIQSDSIVENMEKDINNNNEFNDLFENYQFKILSKVKNENIYKSLNITPYIDEIEIEHIGDAKNKILSTILKSKIVDKDKVQIFLVEEPENHLYVLLQKMYIKSLLDLKPDQIIFTTHSPFTIDFEKINQIIKIVDCKKVHIFNKIKNEDFKKYGYLINIQIAEMLYYDEVLLVEGNSEKYFYSYLMSKDENFLKLLNKRRLGICSIDGIAFRNAKELLTNLGVKVFIKTDNDIFGVPKKNQNRYAGILRSLSYLSNEQKEELLKKTRLTDEDFYFDKSLRVNTKVESNMQCICDYFRNKGIFLSQHSEGFEKDFVDFLKLCGNDVDEVETISYLKNAKLKNLHEFINENDFIVKVDDNSKKSILVNFLYE